MIAAWLATARDAALAALAAVVVALVRGYWRLHSRVTRLEALDEADRDGRERRP